MDLFSENTNDFFIRIIANKKDNFRIDIYDYEIGICYTEVPYDLMFDSETEKQVNKLSLQIRTLKDRLEKLLNPSENLAKEIESEIKSKVKEKVIVKTPTYKTYYGGYQQSWNTNPTKEKKTIIMVTHDRDLAKYANKIIMIKDGVASEVNNNVAN